LVNTILPLGGGPDGKSPIYLKKGTRVLHFPYSMHRRVNIYGSDALEFKPERWQDLRTRYAALDLQKKPSSPNCTVGNIFPSQVAQEPALDNNWLSQRHRILLCECSRLLRALSRETTLFGKKDWCLQCL
jgi:hypothetical protein